MNVLIIVHMTVHFVQSWHCLCFVLVFGDKTVYLDSLTDLVTSPTALLPARYEAWPRGVSRGTTVGGWLYSSFGLG